MTPLVSVLIVEPSEIIVEGLCSLLKQAGGYNFLAPMHEAAKIEERLQVLRPDLLIVNPTLLGSNPKQLLSSISALLPQTPIVALVYQYVESGVMDNFKHVIDIRQTRSALLSVLKSAVDQSGSRRQRGVLSKNTPEHGSLEEQESYELSDRETDVLLLVAKGLSSKQIADKLNISVHTVNSHRKNITHKTGIKSVAGLAVYAMIHNLM